MSAYDVEASFLRNGEAGATRLSSGDRVRPGDWLTLEVRATRDVWVYVLDEDERGEQYLLFPQPSFDQANPLVAGAGVARNAYDGRFETEWRLYLRYHRRF
jgi:hypothetical protein